MLVINALRAMACQLSTGSYSDTVFSLLCPAQELGEVVYKMISSSFQLVTVVKENIEINTMRDFLDCTSDWIECIVRCTPPLTAAVVKQLSSCLSTLIENAKSDVEGDALAGMVRRVLEGLKFSEWPALYSANLGDELRQSLCALLETAFTFALDWLKPLMPQSKRKHVPDLPSTSCSRLETFLLIGDLLRFEEPTWLPDTSELVKTELQELCIHGLDTSTGDLMSDECWSVLCYLIGCVSHCQPSLELLRHIADVIASESEGLRDVSLLEACFCHAIPSVSSESLRSIAEHVLKLVPQSKMPSVAARIRLLRFLIRYAEHDDQIEVLASLGWDMFMFVLKPLHRKTPGEKHWPDHVVGACSLAEDLVKRRDVLTFRERHIALLLSYICTTLGPASGKKDTKSDVDNTTVEGEVTVVYSALAGLFSTVFQRYTKQLYACIPSAISVLRCFLRHTMYCSPTAGQIPSNDAVNERGQRLARICEQLVAHKDIYKKHVIGLVLEFVHDGLGQSSIDLNVRNSLLPAIFSLLDTMSTYEMKQLDAHMDTKAKVLFRSIHQGYQKTHTYKGQ